MLRKFIRKSAVKSWQKELDRFNETYSQQTKEKQADYFIFSVRTRAGVQVEGLIALSDGYGIKSPELQAYPIMLNRFESMMKHFSKQGAHTEAFCISIWVHTLRAFLWPELRPSSDKMWSMIMETGDYWPQMLDHHYKLDVADGIDAHQLADTYNLAQEILKTLPPRPIQ